MDNTKSSQPFVLAILDGFGLADFANEGNAVTDDTADNIFNYFEDNPSSKLKAHGRAVGLFEGQTGNSEAGHFNIGAGRVVEQDLYRISKKIDSGEFFDNQAFLDGINHVKTQNSQIHVLGLLTDNNSPHARPEHLYALLELFRQEGLDDRVYLHLFTDGRDSSPHSALNFLSELKEEMTGGSQIGSVMGRFYGMDRNKNWDRTERAYHSLTMADSDYRADSAEAAIEQAYNRGETDEYIKPTIIGDKGSAVATIEDNDSVYFYNARSDRARQLTKVFAQKDFLEDNSNAFKREEVLENINFIGLTDFGPDLDRFQAAFPSPDIPNCLAKAIDDNRNQLYVSETEKYAHITFFLNGGYPKPINGEDRELIKSDASKTFADNPQMEARQITNKVRGYLRSGKYDFICLNFPNADMVGHTGDISAAKKAVELVDRQIARIADVILEFSGTLAITGDHGNAEEMRHQETEEKITEHSTNPVPFILVDDDLKNKDAQMQDGKLADIAPTLLNLMDIEPPEEMTGDNLIE